MTATSEFPTWISKKAAASLTKLQDLGFEFDFGSDSEETDNVFGNRYADERFDRLVMTRGKDRVSYGWSGLRQNNPRGPAPRSKQGALEDVLAAMVSWLTEKDES